MVLGVVGSAGLALLGSINIVENWTLHTGETNVTKCSTLCTKYSTYLIMSSFSSSQCNSFSVLFWCLHCCIYISIKTQRTFVIISNKIYISCNEYSHTRHILYTS